MEVFSIGVTLYIKIEAENNKMHHLEQIYGRQFEQMGKMVFIEITGQLLSGTKIRGWPQFSASKGGASENEQPSIVNDPTF